MNMPLTIILASALYFLSGTLLGVRLFSVNKATKPSRTLCLGLGFAAVLLHLWILYQALHTGAGINFGFFNAVSFAAWVMVLLFLLSSLRKPLENLGIALLPFAGITLILVLMFPTMHILPEDANWNLRTHVLTSLLAYSVLAMASVQAILLAVQDTQLRKHHPGGFIRALPPLQTMESLLFEMILIGFVLLSIALLTGFLFLEDMFAQHVVHKTILSMTAWVAFAVLLWGRYRYGWRGRKAIYWVLAGFAILALAYFGSKAVMELI